MWKLIGTYAVKLAVWALGHPDYVADVVESVQRARKDE